MPASDPTDRRHTRKPQREAKRASTGPQASQPDRHQVWQIIQSRALDAMKRRLPIFTLKRGVRNLITEVNDASIRRISVEGTAPSGSVIRRGMVLKVWDALIAKGWSNNPGDVPYFTLALLQWALRDHVEYLDVTELGLRGSPAAGARKDEKRRHADGAGIGTRGGGGEGPVHEAIKELVYSAPDAVLAPLGSVPYAPHAIEYSLGNDRVDVVLRDCEGRIVLVEVKPDIRSGDRWPFAQAAKYRTLWHILNDDPIDHLRAVVVAPKIPRDPATRMEKHGIESVQLSKELKRQLTKQALG